MFRIYVPRSFIQRADMAYIGLVKNSIYLETLSIKERISTATCLLIVYYGSKNNLKNFYLRRNCVIIRNEYRKYSFEEENDDNQSIHKWLEQNCRQYEQVENAVSTLFGRRWKMLSDWEYNRIRL